MQITHTFLQPSLRASQPASLPASQPAPHSKSHPPPRPCHPPARMCRRGCGSTLACVGCRALMEDSCRSNRACGVGTEAGGGSGHGWDDVAALHKNLCDLEARCQFATGDHASAFTSVLFLSQNLPFCHPGYCAPPEPACHGPCGPPPSLPTPHLEARPEQQVDAVQVAVQRGVALARHGQRVLPVDADHEHDGQGVVQLLRRRRGCTDGWHMVVHTVGRVAQPTERKWLQQKGRVTAKPPRRVSPPAAPRSERSPRSSGWVRTGPCMSEGGRNGGISMLRTRHGEGGRNGGEGGRSEAGSGAQTPPTRTSWQRQWLTGTRSRLPTFPGRTGTRVPRCP